MKPGPLHQVMKPKIDIIHSDSRVMVFKNWRDSSVKKGKQMKWSVNCTVLTRPM